MVDVGVQLGVHTLVKGVRRAATITTSSSVELRLW
jgi:hypothetical protein